MDQQYNFPVTGINKYVSRYIHSRADLAGKKVLDCPAGDGRTSYILDQKGAQVTSGDLFPEFFKVQHLKCQELDIAKGLPFPDSTFDMVVCQEGIEHFPDQLAVLREFARVLKKGGELLITTPNVSQLRAKLAHFLNESDSYKRTPPSEMDSVWFSDKNADKNSPNRKDELYFGHVFLINLQKLRTLGVFSGLEIARIFKTQTSATSLFLTVLLYPLIVWANFLPFIHYTRKLKIDASIRRKIMRQQFCMNCSFKVLTSKHTMVLFKKTRSAADTVDYLKALTRD